MAYILNTTVSPHDIDTNCNATPSAILRYFGDAADGNMRECKPSYQELFNNGLSFIVSRSAINIYRPLKEYEKLSVSTWPTPSKGASFPRNYKITVDGETVAECVMIWALLNINEKRLLRGDEFDISVYGSGDKLDFKSQRLKIPKKTVLKHVGNETVAFKDIDRNRHMNNTRYLDILFGYIPDFESYYMKSCLVNYINEAKLGETLKVFISESIVSESGEISYYFKTEVSERTNIEARLTLGRI